MEVKVYANGDTDGQGTHVSIRAPILEGKHDAGLKWPFVGIVTLTLLNQLSDVNHHTSVLIISPEDDAVMGSNWGRPKFIPHSALAYDQFKNTHYLKDDTLYFRMSVEVADHKPWLQCRIDQNSEVKDAVAELQVQNKTLKSNESKVFILSQYQKKKERNEEFHFPPFYTSPNGYHMALEVYVNGCGDDKGTHVSVFLVILEGKYDAELKWPFVGDVKIMLLNQLEDENHHTETITFTAVDDMRPFYVPRGIPKFIANSALASDLVNNQKYLKDDTLYFRVSVVKEALAEHKPWLQ